MKFCERGHWACTIKHHGPVMYSKLTHFIGSVFYIVGHKFTTFDKHTSLLRNLYIKTRNFYGTCLWEQVRKRTVCFYRQGPQFMNFCNKLECVYLASLVQCLWVRPGAYPRVEHQKRYFTRVGPSFTIHPRAIPRPKVYP